MIKLLTLCVALLVCHCCFADERLMKVRSDLDQKLGKCDSPESFQRLVEEITVTAGVDKDRSGKGFALMKSMVEVLEGKVSFSLLENKDFFFPSDVKDGGDATSTKQELVFETLTDLWINYVSDSAGAWWKEIESQVEYVRLDNSFAVKPKTKEVNPFAAFVQRLYVVRFKSVPPRASVLISFDGGPQTPVNRPTDCVKYIPGGKYEVTFEFEEKGKTVRAQQAVVIEKDFIQISQQKPRN